MALPLNCFQLPSMRSQFMVGPFLVASSLGRGAQPVCVATRTGEAAVSSATMKILLVCGSSRRCKRKHFASPARLRSVRSTGRMCLSSRIATTMLAAAVSPNPVSWRSVLPSNSWRPYPRKRSHAAVSSSSVPSPYALASITCDHSKVSPELTCTLSVKSAGGIEARAIGMACMACTIKTRKSAICAPAYATSTWTVGACRQSGGARSRFAEQVVEFLQSYRLQDQVVEGFALRVAQSRRVVGAGHGDQHRGRLSAASADFARDFDAARARQQHVLENHRRRKLLEGA